MQAKCVSDTCFLVTVRMRKIQARCGNPNQDSSAFRTLPAS